MVLLLLRGGGGACGEKVQPPEGEKKNKAVSSVEKKTRPRLLLPGKRYRNGKTRNDDIRTSSHPLSSSLLLQPAVRRCSFISRRGESRKLW